MNILKINSSSNKSSSLSTSYANLLVDKLVGLLKQKKAYVVISSGGTEIESEIDFAGKYIKHFLNFLGINDVEFVKLDQLMLKSEEKLALADEFIKTIK